MAVLCALALLLALVGCAGGRTDDQNGGLPESSGGKDVEKADSVDHIFSLNSHPKYSFRPTVATNHANQLVCNLIYENMLELDDNFEVIEGAGLITSWSVSADGKAWTFYIDTEHMFHVKRFWIQK